MLAVQSCLCFQILLNHLKIIIYMSSNALFISNSMSIEEPKRTMSGILVIPKGKGTPAMGEVARDTVSFDGVISKAL